MINTSIVALGLVLLTTSSARNGWKEWFVWNEFPEEIGCINGSLSWKQISSADWNDPYSAYTNAKVELTVKLENGQVLAEPGEGRVIGLSRYVAGRSITAGIGTLGANVSYKGKTLCREWKGEPPSKDFYIRWSEADPTKRTLIQTDSHPWSRRSINRGLRRRWSDILPVKYYLCLEGDSDSCRDL